MNLWFSLGGRKRERERGEEGKVRRLRKRRRKERGRKEGRRRGAHLTLISYMG